MKIKKHMIAISIGVISFFLVSALAPVVTAGRASDSESMVISGSVDNVIEDPGDGDGDGDDDSYEAVPGDFVFCDIKSTYDKIGKALGMGYLQSYEGKSNDHCAMLVGERYLPLLRKNLEIYVEACPYFPRNGNEYVGVVRTMGWFLDLYSDPDSYEVGCVTVHEDNEINMLIKEIAAEWAWETGKDFLHSWMTRDGRIKLIDWEKIPDFNFIDRKFYQFDVMKDGKVNVDLGAFDPDNPDYDPNELPDLAEFGNDLKEFFCSELLYAAYCYAGLKVLGKPIELCDPDIALVDGIRNSQYVTIYKGGRLTNGPIAVASPNGQAYTAIAGKEFDVDASASHHSSSFLSIDDYRWYLEGEYLPMKMGNRKPVNTLSLENRPDIQPGEYTLILVVYDEDQYRGLDAVQLIVEEDPSCFLADTKIKMAEGAVKNIQDIQIGDLVESFDEKTQEYKPGRVTNVFHHSPEEMTDYYLMLNDDLKVTPNHPVYVNGKWIAADELQIGDYFGTKITSIQRVYQQVPTYNFEVEPYHTYNVVWGTTTSIVHNMGAETGESVKKKIGGNGGGGGHIDGMEGKTFDGGYLSTSGDKTPQAAATQPAIQQVQLCLDIDEFANSNKNISPGLFFPILTSITPTSSSTQPTTTGPPTSDDPSNAEPSTNSQPTTSDPSSLTLPNLNIYIIVEEVIKKQISNSKEKLVNDVSEETKDAKSSTSNSESKEDIKIESVSENTNSYNNENIQQTKNQDVTTQNTNTVEDNTAALAETKTTEEDISTTQGTTTINTVEDNAAALAEVNSQQTNAEIKTSSSAEDTKDSSLSSIDDSSAITKTIKDVSNSINLLQSGLL